MEDPRKVVEEINGVIEQMTLEDVGGTWPYLRSEFSGTVDLIKLGSIHIWDDDSDDRPWFDVDGNAYDDDDMDGTFKQPLYDFVVDTIEAHANVLLKAIPLLRHGRSKTQSEAPSVSDEVQTGSDGSEDRGPVHPQLSENAEGNEDPLAGRVRLCGDPDCTVCPVRIQDLGVSGR